MKTENESPASDAGELEALDYVITHAEMYAKNTVFMSHVRKLYPMLARLRRPAASPAAVAQVASDAGQRPDYVLTSYIEASIIDANGGPCWISTHVARSLLEILRRPSAAAKEGDAAAYEHPDKWNKAGATLRQLSARLSGPVVVSCRCHIRPDLVKCQACRDAVAAPPAEGAVRRGTLRWLGLNPDAEVVSAHDFDHLAAENARLRRENDALRNLANNLQPGPISEAMAGTRYTREAELVADRDAAVQRLEAADNYCEEGE
jgi:hypothetical protein